MAVIADLRTSKLRSFLNGGGVKIHRVVATGGAWADEVQEVTVDATAGDYKLSFNHGVTVTGSAGGPFTVTFVGPLGLRNVAELVADGTLLTGSPAIAVVETTPGNSTTNEVQTVTVTATGGFFTLSYQGAVTPSIAEAATAATVQAELRALATVPADTTAVIAEAATGATVQTALRALASIGATGVGVSGGAGGPHTVTFAGPLAKTDVQLLGVVDDTTTGGAGVSVAQTTAGNSGDITVSGIKKGAVLLSVTEWENETPTSRTAASSIPLAGKVRVGDITTTNEVEIVYAQRA